jgi:hypothetical protein
MDSTTVAMERVRDELITRNKRTRPAAPGLGGVGSIKCLGGAWS